MLFHFGRAGVVLGWILIFVGIGYVVLGGRGVITSVPGSLPRVVVGLVGVAVGSAILRWARRAKPE